MACLYKDEWCDGKDPKNEAEKKEWDNAQHETRTKAISNPPPKASPSMAATIGFLASALMAK